MLPANRPLPGKNSSCSSRNSSRTICAMALLLLLAAWAPLAAAEESVLDGLLGELAVFLGLADEAGPRCRRPAAFKDQPTRPGPVYPRQVASTLLPTKLALCLPSVAETVKHSLRGGSSDPPSSAYGAARSTEPASLSRSAENQSQQIKPQGECLRIVAELLEARSRGLSRCSTTR